MMNALNAHNGRMNDVHQNWSSDAFEQSAWMPRHNWYTPIKFAVEFLGAVMLLVLAAPVILLAALFVKATSSGPAFYSQTRLGRFGRHYTIFKLRTMTHNCEDQSGPCWALPEDPRITPVGHFLRKTHIDELPQLWNVLRGDMSLVGPRPERPEFLPSLEHAIPHYRDRLLVRPGVTGLAQVQLPPDTDMASVRLKLSYDLYYIRSHNPLLDFRIVFCTVFHVAGVPYELLRRLFNMPSDIKIQHAYRSATPASLPIPHMQAAV